MKSERRHQLQENVLADWLAVRIETLKPYASVAAGAIIVALVVWGVWTYTSSRRQAQRGEAWNELFAAMDPQTAQNSQNPTDVFALRRAELEKVSKQFAGSAAANWALVQLGEAELEAGLQALYQNRADAQAPLTSAVEYFNKARAASNGEDALLEQRAAFGLARAQEALFHYDEARKEYEWLADKHPNGMYGEYAREQLARLDSQASKKWYEVYESAAGAAPSFGPGNPPFDPHSFPFDTSSTPPSPAPEGSTTPPLLTPPANTTPETTPEKTAPDATAPEKATPEKTEPEATPPATPESPTPEKTTPDAAAPEKAAPEKAAPETSAPEKTEPEAATP